MGLAFAEIDTSDGVTIRHHFDWQKNEPIVPRFTLDVTNDLVQQSTIVHTYALIEKVLGVQGFGVGGASQNLPIGNTVPWDIQFPANNAARIAIWTWSGTIATNPGDLGGYILWVNGLTSKDFGATLDGEVFKYRVYAWVRDTDFLIASQEWLFIVSGRP